MIIYKCDFCGTEILKPNIIKGLKDWECAELSLDLCDRCYRGLNSYVDKCFDAMGVIMYLDKDALVLAIKNRINDINKEESDCFDTSLAKARAVKELSYLLRDIIFDEFTVDKGEE